MIRIFAATAGIGHEEGATTDTVVPSLHTSSKETMKLGRVTAFLLAFALPVQGLSGQHDALSRSRFLSSTAATFLVSTGVLAVDPESDSCTAAAMGERTPRYIDRELEMKYGEDSSEYKICIIGCVGDWRLIIVSSLLQRGESTH